MNFQYLKETLEEEWEDWINQAACKGLDVDLFFPRVKPSGKLQRPLMSDLKIAYDGEFIEARETCLSCPVNIECLEYAMIFTREEGMWGGQNERERALLRRKYRNYQDRSTLRMLLRNVLDAEKVRLQKIKAIREKAKAKAETQEAINDQRSGEFCNIKPLLRHTYSVSDSRNSAGS